MSVFTWVFVQCEGMAATLGDWLMVAVVADGGSLK